MLNNPPKNWSRVLFTKYRYSLNTDSRRSLIWREEEIRNLPSFFREISRFHENGSKVNKWKLTKGHTKQHIFKGDFVTAGEYVGTFLNHELDCSELLFIHSFLMDDNTRLHPACVMSKFLQTKEITRLDCRVLFTRLEHRLSISERPLEAHQVSPRTFQKLKSALLV